MAETSSATEYGAETVSIFAGFDWLGWAQALLSGGFILTGTFFVLAGAFGVIRMPDFFTRIHAAGMTDTMGAEFILIGLIIQAGISLLSLKLLLVAFLLFVASPTATHAIANAAKISGLKPQLGPYRAPSLDEINQPEDGAAK